MAELHLAPGCSSYISGSHGAGLGQTASASPENVLEMQIIGFHPDWLNQNLQGGAQPSLLLRPPGDSDVHSHVRNICFAATSVSSLTGTKLP